MTIFGVKPYLTAYGIDYQSLMIFCAMWGMGGAFIALLLSKWMAKHTMNLQMIDFNTTTGGVEHELYILNVWLSVRACQ